MKKYLLLSFMLLVSLISKADVSFSMSATKVKAGDKLTLPVVVTNDEQFAGFELRIYLPEGISFQGTTRATRIQAGSRLAGFTITGKDQDDKSYKILVASLEGEMIATGDDALFNILLHADENATLGNSDVKLAIIRYTDTNETLHNLSDVTASVKIYKMFDVTASPSGETMGSVAGAGSYESGTNATLTATANTGYEFTKWSNDVTDNPYVFAVNSDVTLTAMFQAITYSITYNLNGGSLTTDKNSFTIDTETFTLDSPTKTGYDFGGWFDNEGLTGTAVTQITKGTTGAKTLYAKWTPTQYTITYNLNGGSIEGTNPANYTIESADITLINPTKIGYTFAGWTGTGLEEAAKSVTIAKGSMGNRSYTATWTINQYTITFDTKGGSEVAAITLDYGAEVTAPADPTKNGYTFGGWDPALPATMPVDGAKLTAIWTPTQYTLTYNLNGGSIEGTNPANYTIESENITLTNPTREGYIFAGWTGTGLEETAVDVTIAKGSMGNRSYVATWTPITYTLTYDLAGGAVATANPTEYNIESAAITLTNPTREGYTFAGWTGTGLSGATQTVTIANGSTGNRSYVATWTPITYTLTYDLAGGSVATANPANYTIESENITLTNPTREGYTFAGWIGTGLEEAAKSVTIAKGSMGNRSYTATWTINQYSMTFVFGNGQENQVITQDYGTALTAPTPNEWTGHTFKGWNPEVPATIPAEDKTFTAQWDVNKYKLTFMVDDQVYSQTDVEYDAAIVVPENPTKEGYTFTSWDAAIPEKMPANDLTFNAQFTINQYSMTFVFGNGQENQVITQDYGTTLTAPTPNEWTGHTFKGWNPEVPATIPAEDKTFTAQWDVNKYKLTFMVDDQVYSQTDVEYDAAIVVPENPTKEGYTFTSWDAAIPEKMPANDLTFNAQFTINQYYVIYIVKEQEWARDQFNYGETIVLRDAPTLEPGEIFVRWESDEVYVTMPAHDITYTAVIDLPNGIVHVFQDKETAAVYTITGVLIDKNMSVSEVMKLAKGLYIVNGHKIYIK